MRKKLIFDSLQLEITLDRLCQQLIENHGNFEDSVIIGLQPRGIYLAAAIHRKLKKLIGKSVPLGFLDATFHRDDFRRREIPVKASQTKIDFVIEGKKVILIDDVLFTGRTVRSAMDAMMSFGRPEKVELLVLIDRIRTRDLPISANYTGKAVNTLSTQKILVELTEQGAAQNRIWLTTQTNT
jgi:pyrimidine operon attenuation protein/uracil phosphoribosyltransferase